MPKPGQRSSGGKAPPKKFNWPPKLYQKEMEDVESRSIQTQAGHPTASAEVQTYKSTSDQQFQVEQSSRTQGVQAQWVCRNAKRCSCRNCFVD